MFRRLIAPLALVLSLAACQQMVAESSSARPTPGPTAPLLVAVIDARPYVASGDEAPSFIGTERGRWGQVQAVETASGRPLAEDIAEGLLPLLAARGLEARVLPLKRGAGVDEAVAAFRATGAERLLLIRVEDWRSDAYTRVTIRWALEAIVFDRSGTYLGRRRIVGSEAVGETSIDDPRGAGQEALARKLVRLLDDPAIAVALA